MNTINTSDAEGLLSKGLKVLAAASAITLGLVAGAHAQSTLEKAKNEGVIRIGFANEAPYGYATPSGELTGEAPAVAKEIFSRLGIESVEGVLTEFGSLIPGLRAGRFDVIAAGMFITPERCAQIQFSEPSYGIGQAFLVPEGNPNNLTDYSSVAENADMKLAVLAGGVEPGYAEQAGVSQSQLMILPDQASLVNAVRSGRAQAAALTALSIKQMADANDGVESTEPFGEVAGQSVVGHGGFGFRPDDTELYEAFNEELKKFVGTQEHIELVTEFGFGEGFMPTKTTAELCAGE
ncbi:ectoine/hydroxyectoine ABC transporter substrate-binding protein EhuB [Nitratireductor aestuarii]|uniref:Ectoine/hydroxyectoine ABC transporter substrate-binding protein EhuB n=1 Tax=Nitratireductor aestuarii TaxID=1735103 RepID=A0A916RNV6_9HYPH|nr:ectoine/hydroxyectoine ABC transporter substrate-binding protein EhuB [Nitratireductor aestuarii]GGA62969.1 ectoine/hydroxyectoine ABC transporter substrate-binding protein EhuB [Nitratireductor aestuarii]